MVCLRCMSSLLLLLLFGGAGRDRRMTHLLRGAMAEWEKHTCVRFRPRSNQTDYIEFYYGDGSVDYVTNSHYITYTFLLKRLGECTF